MENPPIVHWLYPISRNRKIDNSLNNTITIQLKKIALSVHRYTLHFVHYKARTLLLVDDLTVFALICGICNTWRSGDFKRLWLSFGVSHGRCIEAFTHSPGIAIPVNVGHGVFGEIKLSCDHFRSLNAFYVISCRSVPLWSNLWSARIHCTAYKICWIST